jgi:hypothetical protein
MNISELRRKVIQNSAECARLHGQIHSTFKEREETDDKRYAWIQACAEFHARFDQLSFPGGYSTAAERIARGDAEAIEAAIIFLELRPYFLHSGYMFKELIQRCKRAELTPDQAGRFSDVLKAVGRWKAAKREQREAFRLTQRFDSTGG